MAKKKINTLRELISFYDKKKERDIKTATKITNGYTRNVFAEWLDFKLSKITTELIEEEILNPIYESKSVEYTNKIRTYINKIFNWAVKEELVEVNPVSGISEYKDPDKIKQDLIYYSPDEWKIIYSGFEKLSEDRPIDYPYQVIVSVLYYMGIRVGEALALRRSDIIDNEYIRINKTCTFVTKKVSPNGYIVTAAKTENSNRRIKMPIVLQRIMKQYLKMYKKRYSKDAPFLFGGYAPIHIRNVRKKFAKVTDNAELPKIKLHSLRHSHASLLINRGVVTKVVAERLGNTEAEVLKTYSHLFKSTSDACVEVIDAEFLISTQKDNIDDQKTSIAILKVLGYNLNDIYQQLSEWNQKNISYMQVVKGITDQLMQN